MSALDPPNSDPQGRWTLPELIQARLETPPEERASSKPYPGAHGEWISCPACDATGHFAARRGGEVCKICEGSGYIEKAWYFHPGD